jgi:hypothetical protein
MKILTTLIVSSALAVGGYYAWQKPPQPKDAPVLPATIATAATSVAHVAEEPLPNILNAVGLPDAAAAPTPALPDAATVAALPQGEPTAVVFEPSELITAVEQGFIQPTIRGNGRDSITAQLRNNSPTPLKLTVPVGQVFENGRNVVITLRAAEIEVLPAQTANLTLTTAALLSSNKLGETPYKLSYQYVSRVAPFLRWLVDHQEVNAAAAQTAVLSLMENLPVSAFAKFAPANGIVSKLDTTAFRVETSDLISALTALRASGARVESLALANDMQLKLELMIEPLSREAAKRFYGINEESEWEFWKNELLQGDPSIRHYALFGIARFYPEIALEMLPKWVREAKTHPVYRMSAIQAIADTQKPEALSLLLTLSAELGAESELGKAAGEAASFLDQRLSQLVQAPVVAFRGKPAPISF